MDLGARPHQVLRHVVLPLALPGVFASFIFVFIPMVGEYVTPSMVGGAHGMMVVSLIVSHFQSLRFGSGSAMVFLLTGLTFLIVLAVRRLAGLERIYGI
ncbi:MAG: ABC transporter permease subunit, partial [Acetobacteraceae bacterium]|nr:ABC transporter permease subunit [Acetobacteraceae bacterium]